MENQKYYDGLNTKLFNAIPVGAKKVLELGCANGRLGGLYKSENPACNWTGIDISEEALSCASKVLDRTFNINLNISNLSRTEDFNSFDTVVIGDLLEHLAEPEKLLKSLLQVTADDAKIICCLPNMAHISVIQKIISGDLAYDEMGLMDRTHLKLFSPSSAFKIFLDGGWLPNLVDQYRADPPKSKFTKIILQATASLGVPEKTALRTLGMYQMIVECTKNKYLGCQNKDHPMGVSVVVAVNREWEFDSNISQSPGLKEINAEIIPIRNAKSAAAAFEEGKLRCKNSWILFAHQDVYIPSGSGAALIEELGNFARVNQTTAPIGFAGIDLSGENATREAGLVIDRTSLFQHEPSRDAISIDEFAVVLHKESPVKIDSKLGWHTWATDLCLQAYFGKVTHRASIINVPMFHNSLNDYSLNKQYRRSALLLSKKYPKLNKIETLCGVIKRRWWIF